MEKYPSQEKQGFFKKIENFWYYYKMHTFVALLLICAFAVGVHSCIHRDSVDMYVLFMTNGAYTSAQTDALATKLETYVDDIDGDGEKRVQVITISFSDVLERTDQAQDTVLARMVGQVASGPALFYVFDDANYQAMQNENVEIFSKIDDLCRISPYVEEKRFNATKAGFLDNIEGFDSQSKDYYFGMRNTAGISEEDSRFSQIEQCQNVLERIMKAYS